MRTGNFKIQNNSTEKINPKYEWATEMILNVAHKSYSTILTERSHLGQ